QAGQQPPVVAPAPADREVVVVGRGQAGRLADRAVDVSDDAARPAHDVVVVVPYAPLEPGRAAGRFDAADESRRGERVEGVVHGLKGDVAYAITHPGRDRLGAEVVTVAHGLQQRDAGGRHPQSGTAQLLRGGHGLGCGHGANRILTNTNGSRERMIQVWCCAGRRPGHRVLRRLPAGPPRRPAAEDGGGWTIVDMRGDQQVPPRDCAGGGRGPPGPVSTYRLQLHTGFGFAEAAAIADYLAGLGVSHVYLSPILQAAPGSQHGYDVVDHARVSAELGGEPGFRAMVDSF